jgi:hypothetical protein
LARHRKGLVQLEPRAAFSSHPSEDRYDREAIAGKVRVGNLGNRHGVRVPDVDAVPSARNHVDLSGSCKCLMLFAAFRRCHDSAHLADLHSCPHSRVHADLSGQESSGNKASVLVRYWVTRSKKASFQTACGTTPEVIYCNGDCCRLS